MKAYKKLIISFSFCILFIFTVLAVSTNTSTAQVTPCEERKYKSVCCGPDCEIIGTPGINYCLQGDEDNLYSCCYENCGSSPIEN